MVHNLKVAKMIILKITVPLILISAASAQGAIGFEKLTEYEYRGNAYFTIKNLSLYECQAWCREESECQAATFSFLVNPLVPVQQTICLLHNETFANNPSASPHRVYNTYYMTKLRIRSENICPRAWVFERVPGKMIRGFDNALIFTSTKEACLAACLNEQRFICRSAEFNYGTLQCHLSEYDRRSEEENIELKDSSGTDYFENLCLEANEACSGERKFAVPQHDIPDRKISRYVSLNYYTDRELLASNHVACERACTLEKEFLCRSFLYKGSVGGNSYNCRLFHQDHSIFPDSIKTYFGGERPLIDTGDKSGIYYENICVRNDDDEFSSTHRSYPFLPSTEEQITTTKIRHQSNVNPTLFSDSINGDINCDKSGLCYDVSVSCKDTRVQVNIETNRPFNGRVYALGRSETCNVDIINSDKFRLDLTLSGQDCNTQSANGIYTNTIVVQHHTVVITKTDKLYKIRCTYDTSSRNVTFGMMPIRDPDLISVASAPETPLPKIKILDSKEKEVESVRIGDKLTFRIEIPQNTPYGIFARNCIAMAKDSINSFQIIDDDGCPVDSSIFPHFTSEGPGLQNTYEAFRFTESYGVIFQCTVRYCLGSCEPAICQWGHDHVRSWGKRKKRATKQTDDMTLSQEILVFDLDDSIKSPYAQNENSKATKDYDATRIPMYEKCPTRISVLALAVTCALLVLVYMCTVFHWVLKRHLKSKDKLLK